jgi:hypothetical protein
MTEQPKENSAEQLKPKAAPGQAKGSNCFPIKEVFDEEDMESPAATHQPQGSYRASHVNLG